MPYTHRHTTHHITPPPKSKPTTTAKPQQTASNWVLRESKAVYRAASEGVINLADKFFEMDKADAMRWAACFFFFWGEGRLREG
jgi:hypothetical protein